MKQNIVKKTETGCKEKQSKPFKCIVFSYRKEP